MPVYLSPGMYKIEYWDREICQWLESEWQLDFFLDVEQDQLK